MLGVMNPSPFLHLKFFFRRNKNDQCQRDNPTRSWYVWVITSFLFLSIVCGGTFLVLYMTQPETPTTSWYPIIGISLVCLPWFFWFLTCFYRILSRTFGFRMVCLGNDVHPVDSIRVDGGDGGSVVGATTNASLSNANTSTRNNDFSHAQSSRQVHFGEVVVVTEEGKNSSHGGSSSSSSPHGDSPESEIPLKLSMAS